MQMMWLLLFAVILPLASDPTVGCAGRNQKKDHLDLRYGKIGEDVHLRCLDLSPEAQVEWRVNGTVIPRDGRDLKINGGHLTVPRAHAAQEGAYSCHRPSTGEMLAQMHLELGYPPERPVAQCWAVGYPESVHCSWRLEQETMLNTSFITTYWMGMGHKEAHMECVQSQLKPNSCTIRDFEMFSISPYVFNVTAVNPLGSASRLHLFIVEQIIKPDPPENVTVSPIHGETKKLQVRWDPPKSWPLPQYFPLKYEIRYKRRGANTFKTLGPYERTSIVLKGIWPKMTHTVQVNAKDFTDYGEASAWSVPVSAKPWWNH
ncbi:interleukin-27 subunit beta [Ambystoma mexicanum]|uniref:interleukin-27 subunit beta n=1 Tax=Ambystoma mexicanum TaxID=8296 RepID=UPI0037E780E3